MEPEDEEITASGIPMAYCPVTAKEDCPAGDMRCLGGSCRKLREQAGKLGSDTPAADAAAEWVEAARAVAKERAEAQKAGKGVCPSCGDWLPLDLTEFRCMGKGHHVAVARDSVFPPKRSPPALPKAFDAEAEFQRAIRNVAITLLIVIVLLLALGVFFRRAAPLDQSAPPAREGAS